MKGYKKGTLLEEYFLNPHFKPTQKEEKELDDFFKLIKFVNFNVWGITHISKEFFLIFEIVSDTPLINIDAFSTNCFLSKLLILNSNMCDLSTFLILLESRQYLHN